jgi:hypothetical protein
MATSNLGRPTDGVFRDVDGDDIETLAAAIRQSNSMHPPAAMCACVAIETLAALYELGYRVTKGGA